MAIDVTKFHQTFFEESLEGLELMESGLLELEVGADNNEAINQIFRAAHSIKGGAGTFGFTAVTEFTHLLETILDRRRSGQAEVTQEAVDVLLESIDVLREMLSATRDGSELDPAEVVGVQARLQELVDSDLPAGGAAPVPSPAVPTPTSAVDAGSGDAVSGAALGTWRVTFKPQPHLFRTGNDPVRILGELAELGAYTVVADTSALPALADLDVESCYTAWTVELEGPTEQSAIEQVFEWVEDDAEITITRLDTPAVPAADPEAETAPSEPAAGADADGPAAAPTDTERRTGGERRQAEAAHGPATATTTSIRVDIEKIDTLINMVGELVITQSMLQELAQGNAIDLEKLQEGLADLERNTRELQGSVMQIRMLPISFSFNRLPRLVRDLSGKLGKKVELKIHGETTELDKTVMEKIGDPLVHLIRNALDHGLETPEVRVANGKPETGRITLDAYHEGGNIVIEIADDGAGLNTQRIVAKARERGLVGEDDQLTERQIHDLIFHPGFSTAETISDVSGRGVGMDVVKRNIVDLGGVIEVESAAGKGSRFRIRLPLTLAILDGQVVRVRDQVFIVPLVSIVESILFDPSLTSSLARGAGVYRHREAAIPVIDLSESFGIPPAAETADTPPLLVVVEAEGTRAGILVDDLLAQQQIVIKSLKTNFRAVPGLSGATILGDGTVAMILDVNSVLGLYRQTL
ncbi:MAG: chemotaxis protein CheA [Acidimicrobiales bacterium]